MPASSDQAGKGFPGAQSPLTVLTGRLSEGVARRHESASRLATCHIAFLTTLHGCRLYSAA